VVPRQNITYGPHLCNVAFYLHCIITLHNASILLYTYIIQYDSKIVTTVINIYMGYV
jgi:hypothetical protein